MMNTLDFETQKSIIIEGLSRLNDIGIFPKSFTPPGGRENHDTFLVLEELGFHTSMDWFQTQEGI